MNEKAVHAGAGRQHKLLTTRTMEAGTWIVLALMYLILAATLYLNWWKTNPADGLELFGFASL
jgi:hypothetical protein